MNPNYQLAASACAVHCARVSVSGMRCLRAPNVAPPPLDPYNGSRPSGPRRLRCLVVCVISGPSSARLSLEGSRMPRYLFICIFMTRHRTCMHSRDARYVYLPLGVGPYRIIWLAASAPRGAVGMYVPLCFGPI
jgi:hypothetical protein